jgi:hypothetical protein
VKPLEPARYRLSPADFSTEYVVAIELEDRVPTEILGYGSPAPSANIRKRPSQNEPDDRMVGCKKHASPFVPHFSRHCFWASSKLRPSGPVSESLWADSVCGIDPLAQRALFFAFK